MAADPNSRLWRWLAILAGVAAFVLLLTVIFPGRVRTAGDWSAVGYSTGLVLLLLAGGLRIGPGQARKGLGYAAIWIALFGGLTLLVTFLQSRGMAL